MISGLVVEFGYGRAIAIDVTDLDGGACDELHPEERSYAGSLAPVRGREWVAGRRALRRALRHAGCDDDRVQVAIGSDDRGAPRVPAGMVGSISHKRSLAIALAAPAAGWTVGIDLELAVDQPRAIDIARKVLTRSELTVLEAAGVFGIERDQAVMLRFAIKEAVYKAIDPHLRRYVGFHEVEVWPASDGSVGVVPASNWGLEVEAAWRADPAHLVCTARARRA